MSYKVYKRHLSLIVGDKWFRLLSTTYRVRKSQIGGPMNSTLLLVTTFSMKWRENITTSKRDIQYDITNLRTFSQNLSTIGNDRSSIREKNGSYFKI